MNCLDNNSNKIQFCRNTLNVRYSSIQHRNSVNIISEFQNKQTETYVFFQFYGEFKPQIEKKWILDRNPQDWNFSPFCYMSDQGHNWGDEPIFDLCSIGSIIFNTFLAIAYTKGLNDSKLRDYEVLCGFSWGMMSNDGIKIQRIPIKGLRKERAEFLMQLLEIYYPNCSFKLSEDCWCNFL